MVGARPVTILVLEVVEERPPFRGIILLKKIFLENFLELEARRGEDIE